MANVPKVFISHASEDKERFVLGFATQLRERGIDAWLDKWEMLPGDSLVDRVFEEGIKDAAAFIVVLSTVSVQKKWVREEMNAAFVARISRQCKVIPVVIDACEIPEALKSTLWERISDLSNYEDSLKRIIAAIFGTPVKPPIGAPPAFVAKDSGDFAPELERTDAAVLLRLCETVLEQGHDIVTDLGVLDLLVSQGIAQSDIVDALEVLHQQGLIEASQVYGGGYAGSSFSHARVSVQAFNLYAHHRFPDLNQMAAVVAGKIVNEDVAESNALVQATGYPPFLVEHIVDVFESNQMLKTSKHFGGYYVHSVSPALKRKLR